MSPLGINENEEFNLSNGEYIPNETEEQVEYELTHSDIEEDSYDVKR